MQVLYSIDYIRDCKLTDRLEDLNANMNGENTMESEADGGERDGYVASNNIGESTHAISEEKYC